jgi:hypothetical protein
MATPIDASRAWLAAEFAIDCGVAAIPGWSRAAVRAGPAVSWKAFAAGSGRTHEKEVDGS